MNLFNTSDLLPFINVPSDDSLFLKWIEQEDVIPFLEKEIVEDRIILLASLPYGFLNSVLIPPIELNSNNINDLMEWDVSQYHSWSEVYSSDQVWIEPPLASSSSKIIGSAEAILFARTFDGAIANRDYFQLSQKIEHLLDVHFVSERNAWCKLNRLGDIEDIVKISSLEIGRKDRKGTIISVLRSELERYTTLTDSMLVRMFDFTRYKPGNFDGWHDGTKSRIEGSDITGKLVVQPNYGSYSRGVQVADLRFEKKRLVKEVWNSSSAKNGKYETFIAQDFKHQTIAKISCDPALLGNYFVVSDFPFETSPVFFRAEVLSKYKADREKYTVRERSLNCRGGWELRSLGINDAGQIHTYICDLGRLPYEEQLHWKQFNEAPKAPLSARSVKTDFEGDWDDRYEPLESLKRKLINLDSESAPWWTLRDPKALSKVNYPVTASKDEWAEEILNLDKVLVEGFEEKWLRKRAQELGRSPDDRLRGLKLIEECLVGLRFEEDHAREILTPFHDVHNWRSKLKGHTEGEEALEIRRRALGDFGTFMKHFEDLCQRCDESLETIMKALAV